MTPIPRAAHVLSMSSAVLAAGACAVTLLWDGAFPSTAPGARQVLAEGRAWSAVTLGLALPLLVVALTRARQGSLAGRLTWLGVLAYLVYTYLELAVAPPFSALFLPYVATFACAGSALLVGLFATDPAEVAEALGDRAPRRATAAYAFLMGGGLALAWLREIVARTLAGDFGYPVGDMAVRHVVHVLDLGLQVPLLLAAGGLVLGRRAGGAVAAPIMLVNALCMGTALVAMVVSGALYAGESPLAAAPFLLLPGGALVLGLCTLRAGGPGRADREPGASAQAPVARGPTPFAH